MGPFEILCSIVVVFIAFYYYFTSTFDFWSSRGIRGPRPIPIFGNVKEVMKAKKALGHYLMDVYNDYKDETMIGIFVRRTPVLLIKDPNLIKDVLIRDFHRFTDRGFITYEKTEPLTQHLVALESRRWRPLRINLTPIFTSGKLKEMFSLILQCADNLEQYVENMISKKEPIDCHDLMAKYTTDVIGTCAFGIEMNAISDEDSEFRIMGKKIFTLNWTYFIRSRFRAFLPKFYNILGYILPQMEITKFFTRIVIETIDYRERNNIIKHDFIDALRELKKHPEKLDDIKLTDSLLAAQAYLFFIAGFETSSTAMSHTLYELALNQQIQDKLREEINKEYATHDNDITYDNIKKMNYLDKVFKETLRKYPSVTFLMRKSTTSYTFDGTKISIPKDQNIWIPIIAIHNDPAIYPEPDVFDPERFSEEVVHTRNPMFYLPFGDGPRNCIGIRFANFQAKVGLIKLLRNYKFEKCEKTQIPYENSPKHPFLLAPKNGIYLKVTKIERI